MVELQELHVIQEEIFQRALVLSILLNLHQNNNLILLLSIYRLLGKKKTFLNYLVQKIDGIFYLKINSVFFFPKRR